MGGTSNQLVELMKMEVREAASKAPGSRERIEEE